ncbi:MAG: universal stress protein [Thermoanaerobaculia bacterium]|nr:universal stress protein [Thermoanaerobaculia bacterium]
MSVSYPYRKILVPLDFSEDSRRAFDHGSALAEAAGADLVLLTVIEDSFPYPELFAWDHPDEEFYRSLRTRALERMQEFLEGTGEEPRAEKIVVRGHPRGEIVAVAEDIGADCIVMARHGSGGIKNALMGSTTEGVLRAAHCPVVVLPAPDGSARS